MSPATSSVGAALATCFALASLPACIHATGSLSSGPPPEYEDTPIAASAAPASTAPVATPTPPTIAAPPAPTASAPPGH